MKIKSIVISLFILSLCHANEPFNKISFAVGGWPSSRTLSDWQALNSLVNTSPGEYSHLRGGNIDEEKTGPSLAITAHYFLTKDVALNIGLGYEQGETTARFVEDSAPHSMFWKSRYVYVPVNLEYKVSRISGKRLWFKLFAGGAFHLLNAEIKSDTFVQDILDTDASGTTYDFQYGLSIEYSLTKALSIYYNSTTWKGTIDPLEKNGRALKLSDFGLNTDENLIIRLDEDTQLIGLRYYF
jgi:hypothetical protein